MVVVMVLVLGKRFVVIATNLNTRLVHAHAYGSQSMRVCVFECACVFACLLLTIKYCIFGAIVASFAVGRMSKPKT